MDIPVDTAVSLNPLVAAPGTFRKWHVVAYNLQGAGDVTVKIQNASDNSDIDTIICTTGGGGVVWDESSGVKAAKENVALNLTLSAAVRVVGSVTVVAR